MAIISPNWLFSISQFWHLFTFSQCRRWFSRSLRLGLTSSTCELESWKSWISIEKMGEDTPKAPFSLPDIQVNPSGWGPSNMETKFKDMPYQPFSKSDRLGKVSCSLFLPLFSYKVQLSIKTREIALFYEVLQINELFIELFPSKSSKWWFSRSHENCVGFDHRQFFWLQIIFSLIYPPF